MCKKIFSPENIVPNAEGYTETFCKYLIDFETNSNSEHLNVTIILYILA